MKKTILLSTLAVLALLSISFESFASTGSYSWYWTMCNAQTVRPTMTIQSSVGVSSVTISWNVPPYSYENNFGCVKTYLTGLEISAVVTHPGYNGIWDSFSSSSPSSSVSLSLWVQHCYYNSITHQQVCQPKQMYSPVYGDYVTVSVTPIYNGISHGNTATLKITS